MIGYEVFILTQAFCLSLSDALIKEGVLVHHLYQVLPAATKLDGERRNALSHIWEILG